MKHNNRNLLSALACVLTVTFFVIWNSPFMNAQRIQRHISRVSPLWQDFQRENSGFGQVSFYNFTGGGGMFSAVGEVATDADRVKLRKFMESTDPPRPIHLSGLRVLESEEKIQAGQEARGTRR